MPALLNSKREALAQGLAVNKSQTQAYIDAGYSPRGASSAVTTLLKGDLSILKRRDEIVKELLKREEKSLEMATEKLAITKEWVLEELKENVMMAKQAEPVCDDEGNPIGEYKQNLAAANKALELIGKEIGMFVDRKEIRTGPLGSLSDEQLDQLIGAVEAQLPKGSLDSFGKDSKSVH